MLSRVQRSPFRILPLALALGVNLVVGAVPASRVTAEHQPGADLEIAKVAGAATVAVGGTITYTITVTNDGNAAATTVSVADNLDDDLTSVAGSFDNNPGANGGTGTCAVGAGNSVSCSVGNLAASDGNNNGPEPDRAIVTITAAAPSAACGTVTNQASTAATSGEAAAEQGDNTSAQVSVTVNCPDLHVSKAASTATVSAGTQFSYTITATNDGPAASGSVTVADNLDDDLTNVSATFDNNPSGNGGTGNCTVGGGNTISCPVGTLNASDNNTTGQEPDTATVTILATPSTAACGTVENQASVSGTNEGAADQTDNSSNVVSVTVTCPAPDVSVSKSASSSSVNVGGNAVYTVTVTAGGTTGSTNVQLTDDLPDGQTWTVADGDGSGDGVDDTAGCTVNGGALAPSNGTLSCTYPSLAQGSTRTLNVTATTDSTDCGTNAISNTANVSADVDSNTANNTSGAQTITVACPDVHVTKTASDTSVTEPDTFTYTIIGTNDTAGVSATGVVVSDDLDDDLTLISATYDVDPSQNANDDQLCTVGSTPNSFRCEVGDLAGSDGNTNGAEADTVRVVVTVAATEAACGTVTNQAAISATNESSTDDDDNLSDADPNTAGAQPVSVTIVCPPDVAVEKSASSDEVTADEEYTYTITATNESTGAAPGVEVTDDLADEVTIVGGVTYDVDPSAAGGTGSCTVSDQGNNENQLTCAIGTLAGTDGAAGGPDTAVITITATASADACEDGVDNTASVTATDEPEADQLDNDSEQVSVAVNCPDVSVETTATDTEINSGEDAEYVLTLTAGGTGDSIAVTLEDDLPDGQSWAITDGDTGNSVDDTNGCSTTSGSMSGSNGTLNCSFGNLANGSVRTLKITAVTDATDCDESAEGLIENEVRGNSNNDKKNDNNSHGPAAIGVLCSSLVIDKESSDPNNSVMKGDSFDYLITVTNEGPGAAAGLLVTDDLDNDLVINSATWDVDPGTGTDGTCDIGDLNVVTCDIGGSLAGDDGNGGGAEPDEVLITINVTTVTANCPSVSNQASVSATNEPSALDEEGNISDARSGGGPNEGNQPLLVTVDCNALVVSKSPDGEGSAGEGGVITAGDGSAPTFTISVTNQQQSQAGAAHNVILTDELPDMENGWSIVSFDWSSCAIEEDADSGAETLTCSETNPIPPSQAPNNTRSVTLEVADGATASDCGSILNNATVTTTSRHDIINDGGEIVVECPDLAISKTAAEETVDAGEEVSFDLLVTNITDGDALDATLTDTLPEVGGTWVVSGENADACEIADGVLSCAFGTIAGDEGGGPEAVSVTVSATTTEADCGELENTATTAASNEPSDELTRSDNTSSAAVSVVCPDGETPPNNGGPDDGGTPPTGGQLGGSGRPKPSPAGGQTPNTSLPIPRGDLIGISILVASASLWGIARGVVADRRRRGL